MQTVTNIADVRQAIQRYRSSGAKLGLVPTMGALHEGHLSLVRAARQECDVVMTTIFVNPTQFAPHEDLAKYPKTLEQDLQMLEREQNDLVFVPKAEEIYPPGFSTFIEPPSVSVPLEGLCRPGHFRGVTTIVLKLFNILPADIAFFGQKDFQQCLVVSKMAADLNLPIEIRLCPIIRESDGLAMSSRNRYLNVAEREQAVAISRSLFAGRDLIEGGERSASVVRAMMQKILTDAGIERIDYVAVADPETLAENERIAGRVILLIAAFVGQTRLIDNCLIG